MYLMWCNMSRDDLPFSETNANWILALISIKKNVCLLKSDRITTSSTLHISLPLPTKKEQNERVGGRGATKTPLDRTLQNKAEEKCNLQLSTKLCTFHSLWGFFLSNFSLKSASIIFMIIGYFIKDTCYYYFNE